MICLLLTACMVAGLMPAMSFAAEGKSIQMGTGSIKGYDNTDSSYDYIYYGTQNGTEDIKWRVLDDKTNMGTEGLFLLSDELLGSTQFNPDDNYNNTWQGSNAQDWCNNTFFKNNLTTAEQNAIMGTQKSDSKWTEGKRAFSAVTDILQTDKDKVFFLSVHEVNNDDYGFGDNASRQMDDYWWLRSPVASTNILVGEVYTSGKVAAEISNQPDGARPAFNLNCASVLFTSAAEDETGKETDGMDSGLTRVSEYSGNEWKLTLLDSSHTTFDVTPKKAERPSGTSTTITLNYTGAQPSDKEYISAMILKGDEVLYHGRVAKAEKTGGEVEIEIPADLAAGEYTLRVFNEQYNGAKMTDYASKFANVELTVLSDTTAPTLSNGSATRDSETAATVKFRSDEAGKYYYDVVEKDAGEPTIDTSGMGTTCTVGENTISLATLTGNGAKDIYIVVKDAAENVSRTLQIEIPACTPPPITSSYQISASPRTIAFDNKPEGYAAAPAPQKVTVTNTGNRRVTVNLPESTTGDYIIAAKSGFTGDKAELAPSGAAGFTVQPKIGLSKGAHQESLVINGTNGAEAKVNLSFPVTEAPLPETYTLTVQLNGGSGKTTGGEYAEGDVISIDAGEKAGFRFAGWTASKGGTFGDATKARTTFTMPAGDTTITANWEPVGGAGGGDTEGGANPGDETASAGEAETAQKARKLTAPKKVTVSPSYNKVKVSWKKVAGATGYQVYRSAKKNGKYKKIKTTKARTWTNKKLKTGKTWYYKVRAYKKEKGKTVYSKFSARKKAKVRPTAPVLKVRATKGAVTARWSPVAGATRYQLYRASKKNGKYYRWRETVRKGYVDRKKLCEGKIYYYKARAYRVVKGKKIYGKFSEVKKVRAK